MMFKKISLLLIILLSFNVIGENCTKPINYSIEKNCTEFQQMTKSLNDEYYVCNNNEGEYTIKTNCTTGEILFEDFRSLENIEKSSQVLKLCFLLVIILFITTLLFSLFEIKIKKVR